MKTMLIISSMLVQILCLTSSVQLKTAEKQTPALQKTDNLDHASASTF